MQNRNRDLKQQFGSKTDMLNKVSIHVFCEFFKEIYEKRFETVLFYAVQKFLMTYLVVTQQ